MKLRIFACSIALAAGLLIAAGSASSQEKGKGASKMTPEMQEMMKKYMEMGAPGPSHKVLDNFTGKWDTLTRYWMDPKGQPGESRGTAERRWIMDGRFLLEEGTGSMMGMPFKNMIVMGYDNFKKRYTISYLDSTSTAIYTAEGEIDAAGKVITSFGKGDDPVTGQKDKLVKYVTRVLGRDKHVVEIYDLTGTPNEFKAVEITYTRRQ